MIRRVTFERQVPVGRSVRLDTMDVDDGWTIVEQEPGRVRTEHPEHGVSIHQDVPYTLFPVPDPEPVKLEALKGGKRK